MRYIYNNLINLIVYLYTNGHLDDLGIPTRLHFISSPIRETFDSRNKVLVTKL